MSTTTVTSTAGLLAALQSANGGDTILLAAGNYSGVLIQGLNFASAVTITSADPSHLAVITDLNILSSSNLHLSGLELSSDPAVPGVSATALADPYPFRVTSSSNIQLDHLNVHGSLDGDPLNDRSGPMISNSSNVTITNSEFQQLSFGIVHSLSNNLVFSGNTFHDIESDGIHGSSSFVQITNNYFTNFHPATGDHPDAIQFFNELTTSAPHDILISGNVFDRGTGAAIEGFFLRLSDTSGLAFQNVNITDNLLIGTMYDGITVLGGKNISITGNILASLPDMNSRVWIGNADGVLSQNNTAANFIYGSNTNVSFDPTNTNTNITVTNDVTLAYVSDGGAATLSQWLLTHPALSPLISSVSDPVAPTAPSEPDSVFSDVSYTLGPSSHNLTLTGTAAIDGTGNTLDNVITGNVAANRLDGGSGLDTLIGGGGNDTYVVGNAGDVITENVGEGTDTVLSSVSFILPANVENLTLTGTSAINGTGNALNNVITGNAAANLLDGGLGADNLAGGAGNDTYVVDNTGDTVTEGLSLGTDTVRSSVSFILPANVENLTLTGSSAINGTGNALNNVIAGNAAANQIMGGGGDDTLTGGAGRDTFIFGPGSGHDTVTDFQNSKTGDTVDISAFTNAGYSAHVSDSTQGLVVNFDTGDSIVLIGIHTSVAGLPALSSDLTSTIKGHAFGHA